MSTSFQQVDITFDIPTQPEPPDYKREFKGTPNGADLFLVAPVFRVASETKTPHLASALLRCNWLTGDDKKTLATVSDVGSVWGTAYYPYDNDSGLFDTLFLAAHLHRWCATGPVRNSLSQIYYIHDISAHNNRITSSPKPFVNTADINPDLSADPGGVTPRFDNRNTGNPIVADISQRDFGDPGHGGADAVKFTMRAGFGGLTLSVFGEALYTVNLATRELLRIPLRDPSNIMNRNLIDHELLSLLRANGTPPRHTANLIPFAVTAHKCPGSLPKVYVGYVDNDQYDAAGHEDQLVGSPPSVADIFTVNRSRLRAYVFEFTEHMTSPRLVLHFPLDYTRRPNTTDFRHLLYMPWRDRIWQLPYTTDVDAYGRTHSFGFMPALTKITFDRHCNMIITLTDRSSFWGYRQLGSYHPPEFSDDNRRFFTNNKGDIVRAARVGVGTSIVWEAFDQAVGGDPIFTPQPGYDDPSLDVAPREFFRDDVKNHREGAMGSCTNIPDNSDNLIAFSLLEPSDNTDSAGIRLVRTSDSKIHRNYELYSRSDEGTLGTQGGLGDLQGIGSAILPPCWIKVQHVSLHIPSVMDRLLGTEAWLEFKFSNNAFCGKYRIFVESAELTDSDYAPYYDEYFKVLLSNCVFPIRFRIEDVLQPSRALDLLIDLPPKYSHLRNALKQPQLACF